MERFLAGKYPDIADKLETKAVKMSAEETEGIKETEEKKEETYLERLERIASTERGGQILRNRYQKESLVDTADDALIDKLAQNLFQSEKQQAINEGHGAELPDELSPKMLEKYKETILRRLENQKESLERITTYIENNEDSHPLWFRYFMLRSIQNMGTYDADKNIYLGRTEETIAPFIHLNHEAVGFVRKMLEEKYNIIESLQEQSITGFSNSDKKRLNALEFRLRKAEVPLTEEEQSIHAELKERYRTYKEQEKEEKAKTEKIKQEGEDAQFNSLGISFETLDEEKRVRKLFSERLSTESFQDLYAFARTEVFADVKYVTSDGEWKHFEQGSDPKALEKILENKGTGWCTAAGSAPEHLKGGDFYVYQTYTKEEFTLLESGEEVEPTQPAIAVRMLNGSVYEVRGTEPDQGLTPLFNDVAMDQIRQLPGGEKWEKKSTDMKLLTKLSKKQETNEAFTKEELRFLYEIDAKIEGFGYDKDPRVKEIKVKRDRISDLTIIYDAEGKVSDTADYPWPDDTKILSGQALELTPDMVLPKALIYIDGREVGLYDKGFSADTAYRLIECGRGNSVAYHLDRFTDINHLDIASRLIEAGNGFNVVFYIYKFKGLTPDIANRLIEAGYAEHLDRVLEKSSFTDLTAHTANLLIEAGGEKIVGFNLKKFTNLPTDIAQYLIRIGFKKQVLENKSSFAISDKEWKKLF